MAPGCRFGTLKKRTARTRAGTSMKTNFTQSVYTMPVRVSLDGTSAWWLGGVRLTKKLCRKVQSLFSSTMHALITNLTCRGHQIRSLAAHITLSDSSSPSLAVATPSESFCPGSVPLAFQIQLSAEHTLWSLVSQCAGKQQLQVQHSTHWRAANPSSCPAPPQHSQQTEQYVKAA